MADKSFRSMRTPLARVRGLGSAKEGVHHWWAQRLTALALVPLTLWFVVSVAGLAGMDHAGAVAWIGSPPVTVLLVLLIVPGVLVAIATPVVIRRVTCHQQAAMPALIASVKEVGSSPVGAGLLKWELVAGLLMLGSVLLCGVPLLITIPLGGILVQHYLAYSGLGSTRD